MVGKHETSSAPNSAETLIRLEVNASIFPNSSYTSELTFPQMEARRKEDDSGPSVQLRVLSFCKKTILFIIFSRVL